MRHAWPESLGQVHVRNGVVVEQVNLETKLERELGGSAFHTEVIVEVRGVHFYGMCSEH